MTDADQKPSTNPDENETDENETGENHDLPDPAEVEEHEPADAQESRGSGPEEGPVPERPTDKEPEPGKGEGRKSNVQRAPEDQRARPDPDQREK